MIDRAVTYPRIGAGVTLVWAFSAVLALLGVGT